MLRPSSKARKKMAEYIDREAAINAVEKNDCEGYASWAIKSVPIADVVPRKDYESMERTVDKLNKALAERKHGKWIGIPHKTVSKRNRTIHSMVYICPHCRYSNSRHKSNFCPNCGTRMESEGEDESR